jgi:hypothetical protein
MTLFAALDNEVNELPHLRGGRAQYAVDPAARDEL